MFDKLIARQISADELDKEASKDMEEVEHQLLKTKSKMKGRTSKLWLQYMTMVDILRQFLKAERTGNWILHLKAMQRMLPFLAAAGHSQYTKSIHIYLQHMQKLEDHHRPTLRKESQDYCCRGGHRSPSASSSPCKTDHKEHFLLV